MTLKPGAQRIPTSNEENKSMPTETAKEAPTGDKTTLDMQKVIKFHFMYCQKTFFLV
jgi:hypothetical protein